MKTRCYSLKKKKYSIKIGIVKINKIQSTNNKIRSSKNLINRKVIKLIKKHLKKKLHSDNLTNL